jgi:hypothetical protein
MILSALAALLVPLLWTPAIAQPRFEFDAAPGGLPKDVVPSRYELRFDLDPARSTFPASAAIAVRVRKPVAAIVLHAHQLTAESVSLVAADGSQQQLLHPRADPHHVVVGDLHAADVHAGDPADVFERRLVERLVLLVRGPHFRHCSPWF